MYSSTVVKLKNNFINIINKLQDCKSFSIPRYLFPQQANDSVCHCLFIFNFALLQKIRKGEKYFTWRTQEDWIGITFKSIVAWQKAMDRLTNPKPGEDRAFCEYQNYILQEGIHLDRIYTDSGRKYYKSSLNPLKNLQKVWLSPYHFVCAENHPEVVKKTLPLYSDGNNFFIFDPAINSYQQLPEVTTNCIEPAENLIYLSSSRAANSKFVKLTESHKQYLELPEYSCLKAKSIPSTNNLKQFKYSYKYQYLPEQAKKDVYFHVGLFQLLNLAMGIDQENNRIDQNHKLYPVYNNLRKEMTAHPANLWGLPEFKAENSLEYHLADLFKKNPTFMEEVIKINKYPFNTFEHYEHLDNLYDSKDQYSRKSLAKQKLLLPGREQILAYSFSQSLLTIWTAAISEKALYAVLELPKILRFILYFFNADYHKKILQTVYESKPDARSFIAVWQEIKEMLQKQGITELFSFDGHGVVISFSEELIAMQNKDMDIVDPKLMKDLGFTVIDSLYSEDVRPFYIV